MEFSDVAKTLEDLGFRVRHMTPTSLFAGRPSELGVVQPLILEESGGGMWLLRLAGPGQLSTEYRFATLVEARDYIVTHLAERR